MLKLESRFLGFEAPVSPSEEGTCAISILPPKSDCLTGAADKSVLQHWTLQFVAHKWSHLLFFNRCSRGG